LRGHPTTLVGTLPTLAFRTLARLVNPVRDDERATVAPRSLSGGRSLGRDGEAVPQAGPAPIVGRIREAPV
jgi:hypothetical protein